MLQQFNIAFPVLWPAMLIAATIMLLGWWPRRRSAQAIAAGKAPVTAVRGGWAGAQAIGLAFAASMLVILKGLPAQPPAERWHWLLWIDVAATAVGVAAGMLARFAPLRPAFALLTAASTALLFHPLLSVEAALLARAEVGLVTLALWMAMDSSARRHRGPAAALLTSMIFAALSIVILQGHNATMSLLAASVSAALGAVTLVALVLPMISLADGASHVLAALLAGLVASAWMYGTGDRVSLGLISATPLIVLAAHWFTRGLRSAAARFGVRALATLVPLGLAVALAVAAASRAADEYGY